MSQAGYCLPRNSLVWLLLAVALSVAPQCPRLPYWLTLVVVLILIWRVQVFRQRWGFPNKWLRMALVFGGSAAIYYSYGSLFGPEAGVALLILAYSFKLLEMQRQRDVYMVVILAYFVIATQYLFERGLLASLYSILVIIVVTAALLGLNQSPGQDHFRRTLSAAGKLFLQSLPLMLVLFVLVPRVGPLWSMSLNTGKAKTGISDRMTPGDISELSKSAELAFRAEWLAGPLPSPSELYWRGAVFTLFDGRTWFVDKEGFNQARLNKQQIDYPAGNRRRLEYLVFMKPNQQRWVFALAFAQIDKQGFQQSADLTWSSPHPISTHISYPVVSFLRFKNSRAGLSIQERSQYLQLPEDSNPRAIAWAKQKYQRSQQNPEQYIAAIFAHFGEQDFRYTLRPTPLVGHTIDQFLFATKNGFCSHYAGSLVFLLRAAGIPARMVGGYLGGELDSTQRYLSVRQYNAHAWVEAWLPGQGWRRYDPTMAVAPERILDGPEGLVSDEYFAEDSPLSPYQLRNWPILSRLRLQWDHLDYLWSKWVLGYNQRTQADYLRRFIGEVSLLRIAIALALAVGALLLVYMLLLLWQRSRHRLAPLDRAYSAFCYKAARKGWPRLPHEGPWAFAERLGDALPERRQQIMTITANYVALKYQVPPQARQDTESNRQGQADHAKLKHDYSIMRRQINRLRL